MNDETTESVTYSVQTEKVDENGNTTWVESAVVPDEESAVAAAAALTEEEEKKAEVRKAAGMPVETTGRYRIVERLASESTRLAYDTRGLDGEPTHPIDPGHDPSVDNELPDGGTVDNTLPDGPPSVDNTLPPSVDNTLPTPPPSVDNTLPPEGEEKPPVTGDGGDPDQGLPPTAEPKKRR